MWFSSTYHFYVWSYDCNSGRRQGQKHHSQLRDRWQVTGENWSFDFSPQHSQWAGVKGLLAGTSELYFVSNRRDDIMSYILYYITVHISLYIKEKSVIFLPLVLIFTFLMAFLFYSPFLNHKSFCYSKWIPGICPSSADILLGYLWSLCTHLSQHDMASLTKQISCLY